MRRLVLFSLLSSPFFFSTFLIFLFSFAAKTLIGGEEEENPQGQEDSKGAESSEKQGDEKQDERSQEKEEEKNGEENEKKEEELSEKKEGEGGFRSLFDRVGK